ncbi:MAG: hypothetical protein AB8E82_06270 [Aureispira sp.]
MWKNNKGESFGKVTSWVQKYNKNNERNIAKDSYKLRKSYPNQFFVKHAPLTTAQTKQMMQVIASSQVKTIPDHYKIENWS